MVAGGGSMLRGLGALISSVTLMPVHIADDPLTTVCRGTGIVLENIKGLNEVLVNNQDEGIPR